MTAVALGALGAGAVAGTIDMVSANPANLPLGEASQIGRAHV